MEKGKERDIQHYNYCHVLVILWSLLLRLGTTAAAADCECPQLGSLVSALSATANTSTVAHLDQ